MKSPNQKIKNTINKRQRLPSLKANVVVIVKNAVNKTMFYLLISLFILFSTTTYARPITDIFRSGLIEVNNFFEDGGYTPYAKTIDFVFFALLFISIYSMGVRYAFKEAKRPEKTIAILLGLMTAFLFVLGGWSATLLLPYIHWLLYLLLFMLIWWLLKGIKSRFWRFLLALLLTLLLILLLSWLYGALTVPELERGRLPKGASLGTPSFGGEFLRSFIDSFKGIEFPGGKYPGVPDYLQEYLQPPTGVTGGPTGPETLPITETPKGEVVKPAEEKRGFLGRNWWWILLLGLLGSGVLANRKGWLTREKVKGWFGRGAPPEGVAEERAAEERGEEERTIQQVISEIINYINKKIDILKKINEIIKRKKELTDAELHIYYKVLKVEKPYWLDPESEAYRNITKQQQIIEELLVLEGKLEKQLEELMTIEDEITGHIGWQEKSQLKDVISKEGSVTRQTFFIPFRHSKAVKWIIELIDYDRKKRKKIIEEIEKLEKLSPLSAGEKFLDFTKKLLGLRTDVDDDYKAAFSEVVRLIYELIITYQWDPVAMRFISAQDLKQTNQTWFGDKPSICEQMMKFIGSYFLLERGEKYIQKRWKLLMSKKELKEYVQHYERWKASRKKVLAEVGGDEGKIPIEIKNLFVREENFFEHKFKPVLTKELKHMFLVVRYLKYLSSTSRKEKTLMQGLNVKYKALDLSTGREIETEYNAQEVKALMFHNLPLIPRDKFIGVYTYLETGLGPFKLGCYIDGQLVATKNVEKTVQHPKLEFRSEELGDNLSEGGHIITFYLVYTRKLPSRDVPRGEEGPITLKYRDVKSIKVNIVPSVGPAQTPTGVHPTGSPSLPTISITGPPEVNAGEIFAISWETTNATLVESKWEDASTHDRLNFHDYFGRVHSLGDGQLPDKGFWKPVYKNAGDKPSKVVITARNASETQTETYEVKLRATTVAPTDIVTFFEKLFIALGMEVPYDEITRVLNEGKSKGFLDRIQIGFFNTLLIQIKIHQFYRAMRRVHHPAAKKLFEKFEPDVDVSRRLIRIVEELEQKNQYILTLIPEKNITATDKDGNRVDSIIIIGSHHVGKGDELLIGIEDNLCDIVLEKTAVKETYHAAISFNEKNIFVDKGKIFVIRQLGNTELKINDSLKAGGYLENGSKLQINEYIFDVKISRSSNVSPSKFSVHLTID